MKRRVFTIIVFLLLGAIVNVAVACICFWFSPLSWESAPGLLDKHCQTRLKSYGWDASASFSHTGFGTQYTKIPGLPVEWAGEDFSGLVPVIAIAARCGWPFRGLQVWITAKRQKNEGNARAPASWKNLPQQREELLTEMLSMKHLWRLSVDKIGFAANTGFYAGALWSLTAIPLVLQHRRRIKRGLCPACAYPVGTSPVCTECGQALPVPAKT